MLAAPTATAAIPPPRARRARGRPETVGNHQGAIREKLGVATSATMVHLAVRHGLFAADVG